MEHHQDDPRPPGRGVHSPLPKREITIFLPDRSCRPDGYSEPGDRPDLAAFFFEATAGYLNKFYTPQVYSICWCISTRRWNGAEYSSRASRPPGWAIRISSWPRRFCGVPVVGSFAVLTYLAKLQSIDKQIYEAARSMDKLVGEIHHN